MSAGPHRVYEVEDAASGLHGFLVIDTLVNGRSCGGVRVESDVTLDEIRRLARAMTLKYAFLNDRSLGGAKAGIVMPAGTGAAERQAILAAFGRELAPLLQSERYIPWTDLNTREADIAVIRSAAGVRPMRIPDSAHYTALSVLASIRAACEVRGMGVGGATVAIEGLGHVGTCLAQELALLGARIVAISNRTGAVHDRGGLDAADLVRLREQYGDGFLALHMPERHIGRHELLELDVDVLVPAARPKAVHAGNAALVRARIIAPAANCPVDADAELILQRKGVLVLPDFVCNLGGIYGSRLEGRVAERRIRELFLNEYSLVVRRLLERAAREGRTPSALALEIAESNHSRIVACEGGGFKARRAAGMAGLKLLDGPLIPGWLTDRILFRWARNDLAEHVGAH